MPFTTRLIVSEQPDGKWKLEHPLIYIGAKETFEVPKGFITDFASVPRSLWSIVPPYGKYTKAAVLHDYFYVEKNVVSRKDADGIFRRIMRELGVGKLKRYTMWSAVRLFGGRYFEE